MIRLHRPKAETLNDRTRLSCVIDIAGDKRTAYIELHNCDQACFCDDICDGFLVSILLLAMKNREDIVCDVPVSRRLLYQLTTFMMPFLAHINKELTPINIVAEPYCAQIESKGRVGTGISCGVDSLAAIYDETEGKRQCNDYAVNTLVYLNAGHYGTDENAHAVWEQYAALPSEFAKAHGQQLLMLDSNLFAFLPYVPAQASLFAMCGIILQMQNWFQIYHIASSFTIFDFAADFQEMELYETFALDCLSTENVKFYSSGATKNRIEKLSTFIDDPEYVKYLYSCVAGNGGKKNCSACEKCVRTYLNALALGKTDRLAQTFDIDYMDRHRNYFLAYALKMRRKAAFEGRFYAEIYAELRRNNVPIPIKARLMALLPYHYNRFNIVSSLHASIWYYCKQLVKRILGRA